MGCANTKAGAATAEENGEVAPAAPKVAPAEQDGVALNGNAVPCVNGGEDADEKEACNGDLSGKNNDDGEVAPSGGGDSSAQDGGDAAPAGSESEEAKEDGGKEGEEAAADGESRENQEADGEKAD